MVMIDWNGDLEFGIEVIDNQHRRIVDYINDLTVAIGDDDQSLVKQVLANLESSTRTISFLKKS